jgi:hypothetical protein
MVSGVAWLGDADKYRVTFFVSLRPQQGSCIPVCWLKSALCHAHQIQFFFGRHVSAKILGILLVYISSCASKSAMPALRIAALVRCQWP